MLPANHTEPDFSDAFSTLMDKFRDWVQQEIVDDDPWDQETLFPDMLESQSDPVEPSDTSSADPSNSLR